MDPVDVDCGWSDFSLLFTRICSLMTNPCEQKWEIWPSTSTGTMVFCWSCKQSERERQNKQPTAFSVLIRFWSTHQNWFSPRNGREISSSLFDQTRLGQLYVNFGLHNFLITRPVPSRYPKFLSLPDPIPSRSKKPLPVSLWIGARLPSPLRGKRSHRHSNF